MSRRRRARRICPRARISLAEGRITLGTDIAVSATPQDDDLGWFNYTDYEHSAFRLMRVGVTADVRLTDRVSLLTEVRTENGDRLKPYALYVRVRPWRDRAFDIQAGRIPPTFGAFSRRAYGAGNLLVGYPLAYQYLTALRADAVPEAVDDLFRMRGRGWQPSYPLGSLADGPGMPLITAFRWDTGVQVRVGPERMTVSAAVTNGTVSDPHTKDNNRGKQIAGRVPVAPQCGADRRCIGSARPVPCGRDQARNGKGPLDSIRPRRGCGVLTRLLDPARRSDLEPVGDPHDRIASRGCERLRRRELQGASGHVRGCAGGQARFQPRGVTHTDTHLGRAGHTRRERHRLLHSPEPAGEGRVSIQLARRWSNSHPGPVRGSTPLLAVMPLSGNLRRLALSPKPSALAAAALCASALLLARALPTAQAPSPGLIRGRVEVRRPLPPVERRPSVSDLGMAPHHETSDLRRSVVYLESAPALAFPDIEARRATMDQRNETFVPRVLAVTVGTTVDFPNSDRTYHNVFSVSGPRRFDLGRYAAGRLHLITNVFRQGGQEGVRCRLRFLHRHYLGSFLQHQRTKRKGSN